MFHSPNPSPIQQPMIQIPSFTQPACKELYTYHPFVHPLPRPMPSLPWGSPGKCYLRPGGWCRWGLGFVQKQVLALKLMNEYFFFFFEYFKLRIFCVRNFRSNLQMRTLKLKEWRPEVTQLVRIFLHCTLHVPIRLGENLEELNGGRAVAFWLATLMAKKPLILLKSRFYWATSWCQTDWHVQFHSSL